MMTEKNWLSGALLLCTVIVASLVIICVLIGQILLLAIVIPAGLYLSSQLGRLSGNSTQATWLMKQQSPLDTGPRLLANGLSDMDWSMRKGLGLSRYELHN